MVLNQNETGGLTESRVKHKLESFGLIVSKPVPDVGVDFEVYNPTDQSKVARIQVKGRNPKLIKTYRWFQLRVQKIDLIRAQRDNKPAEITWHEKVRMVDFFILDAVHFDEMWVLTQDRTFELIALNEHQFGSRPDNVFVYSDPQKSKQKEMNLEARVPGVPIIQRFADCRNNFGPILEFLGMK